MLTSTLKSVGAAGPVKETQMTLFRLDASIRAEGSASREIADIVVDEWLATHPGDLVERRHIGVDVLPAQAWASAVSATYLPEAERSPEQRSAVSLAATLVDGCWWPTPSCWQSRCTTSVSRST
jgi:hypothetical protein